MRGLFSLTTCVVLALAIVSGLGGPSKGGAEGEEWMKWSAEMRLLYVSAFLTGYDRGFDDGCKMAEDADVPRPNGLPGAKCISKEPSHSKSLEAYVDLVTEYYTTYPKDRYVNIRTILQDLSDTRHLSLAQIHQYSGEPGQVSKP